MKAKMVFIKVSGEETQRTLREQLPNPKEENFAKRPPLARAWVHNLSSPTEVPHPDQFSGEKSAREDVEKNLWYNQKIPSIIHSLLLYLLLSPFVQTRSVCP